MNPLLIVDVIIPEHGIIRHVSLGMSFMAAIHRRELYRVANKEHREIIEDKILDTLLSVELDRPAPYISNRIARSLLAADS